MFHLIRVRFAHPPAGFPKECLRHGRWLVQYPMFQLRAEKITPDSGQRPLNLAVFNDFPDFL